MKSAIHSKLSEEDALNTALSNYRQTPHPATGLPPGEMLFRDGMKGNFPRKVASEMQVQSACSRDIDQKKDNEDEVNASKHRNSSDFNPGDLVLVRNHNATSKFHPKYTPGPYAVVEVDYESKKIILESTENAKQITRHPDDIKPYSGNKLQKSAVLDASQENATVDTHFPIIDPYQDDYDEEGMVEKESLLKESVNEVPRELNRPVRERKPNQRYINSDFVN